MTRGARTLGCAAIFLALAFAQDVSSPAITKIADGFRFTEGPAWSKEGFLVFSDTPSDRILKLVPGQKPEELRTGAQGPSGNAFDSQGRLYTCETRGRRVVRSDKNRVEVIAERWEGRRLNAPNDLAVSRTGHVYFTDPAFGEQADHRELDFYGVYHVPPRGPMTLVARPAGRPNGIALSPDGRTLYVSNSDERNIRAYNVDRNGETSGERIFVAGLAGVPGGMAVDDKGNLYVAGAGLTVYDSEARVLFSLKSQTRISNCAIGEADPKSLYFTEGGAVFRARLDGKGAPE